MAYLTTKNIGLLLLAGVLVFSVGINQSYGQDNGVSIDDPLNTAPIADDINIQIVPNSEATIQFGANVMDAESDFDELTIKFSINNGGERSRQMMVTSGANQDFDTNGDRINSFTLTAENVVITEGRQFGDTRLNPPRTVTLSYTVSDGELSDTGTVNISVVAALTNTAPTAPTVTASAAQGASGVMDFSGIMDDSDPFGDLNIQFALGVSFLVNPAPNLGDQVDFNAADVSSDSATTVMVDANMVRFTVQDDAVVGTYTLEYVVTDTDGGTSRGTVTFTITAPNAAPTAPDIPVTAVQGASGTMDFSEIMDDSDSFGELDIVLHLTNGTGINPADNLSTEVTFSTTDSALTDTNSRLTVSTQNLSFDVDAEATVGEYNLVYTVTDTDAGESTGSVIFTIAESTTNTAPTTPPIVVTAAQGATGEIVFSGVMDDVPDSLPTIVFHTVNADTAVTNPASNLRTEVVLRLTDFEVADGLDNTDLAVTDLILFSENLTFTVNTDAAVGEYNLEYTVTDSRGLATTGTVTFTITESTSNTAPTTPPIVVTAAQGATGEISFLAIDDDSDTFAQLGIIFHLVNDAVTNPASDISDEVTFNSDDIGFNGGPSDPDVTILGEPLRFTVDDDAIVGEYNLEYTVTDTDGDATTGTVTFTITDPTSNTAPTTPRIVVTVGQGSNGIVDFSEIDDDSDMGFMDFGFALFHMTNSTGNNPELNLSTQVVFNENDGGLTGGDSGNDDLGFLSEIVRFTVNPDATVGTYHLAYTITDSGDLESTGFVTFIIVAPLPNAAPIAPDIKVTAIQGDSGVIDFGLVVDDNDDFEEFTDIVFHLRSNANPAFIGSGVSFNMPSEYTSVAGGARLSLDSETLSFSVHDRATVGVYNLAYTATDSEGLISLGNVIFTIERMPNTAPMTPDITVTVGQGFDGIIDFSVIDDDVDLMFANFTSVTFHMTNSTGDNPEPNLSTEVDFNTNDGGLFNGDSDNDDLAVVNEMLRFTVDDDGELGIYYLTYTVTDSDDAESTGAVIFTIVDPASNTAPIAPNIVVELYPRTSGIIIPFGEHITDAHSTFSDLVIKFKLLGDDLSEHQIFVLGGATRTTEGQNDLSKGVGVVHEFLVDGDGNVILEERSSLLSDIPVPRTIALTYTASDGVFTSTGTVNIMIVAPPTAPLPVDAHLDNRFFDVPAVTPPVVFEETFDGTEFANLMNLVDTFRLIGPQLLDVTVSIVALGSHDGTATFTTNESRTNFLATLRYTPDAGFVGTETFEYTGMTERGSATGIITFNVALPNTNPTANDFNIQILPNTAATIPFGEIINDPETGFDDLDIEFSFVNTDLAANQVSVTSGATAAAGDATFDVDDEEVVITETSDSDSSALVPRTIELTYTASDGLLESTGTINIFIVDSITSTFDGVLDSRTFDVTPELLPTFTETFDNTEYQNLINYRPVFAHVDSLNDVILSIDPLGSSGGGITFTHNGVSSPFSAILTYTPTGGFTGTETFTYTGTAGDVIASGVFTFNVEAVSCDTSLTGDIHFGELGVGEIGDTSALSISNDGNVPMQSLIQGADWISLDDGAVVTMLVGQTRYSVTESNAYDDKTPFTIIPANVGDPITVGSENLDVYIQLLINLIDPDFRGETTQLITFTSDCSEAT